MAEVPELSEANRRRILVLGAYGLIGAGIVRRLLADGHSVTGLGRNAETAHHVFPQISWIIKDLADLCEVGQWLALLDQVDIVVNCAGVLQDSPSDRLDIVHHQAVKALANACKTENVGLVQVSAVGAVKMASTAFMRTKALGDAAVKQADIDYWILRSGLVLAHTSYGGSTLLWMLAGFPLIQPIAFPEAKVQTVSLADLADAVSKASRGELKARTEFDLVEAQPHMLREVVAAHRQWLGFSAARRELSMPAWGIGLVRLGADFLGHLGWRSPLRSSAIQALKDGIIGDPTDWKKVTGEHVTSMAETLAAMPAEVEHRQFSRMALLMPLVIAVLGVFWLMSGLVGLYQMDSAVRILENAGWSHGLAVASVGFWSLVDIAVAAALMVRRYARHACSAMVAVSVFYLSLASLTVPDLWIDPIGPLVKVLPGIVLALVARVMLESR